MQKTALLSAIANDQTNLLCVEDVNDDFAEKNADITTLYNANFDLQHTVNLIEYVIDSLVSKAPYKTGCHVICKVLITIEIKNGQPRAYVHPSQLGPDPYLRELILLADDSPSNNTNNTR